MEYISHIDTNLFNSKLVMFVFVPVGTFFSLGFARTVMFHSAMELCVTQRLLYACVAQSFAAHKHHSFSKSFK